MIRSMTGFGTAETRLDDDRVLRVEIRTVNHRHLSVSARLPRGWEHLEPATIATLRERLARGRVSLSVSCETADREDPGVPDLDMERVRRHVEALRKAGEELAVQGPLDLAALAALPGVWRREKPHDNPPDEDGLLVCVAAALDEVVTMREGEGSRLEEEIRAALAAIVARLEAVEMRAPERLVRERDRLRERVSALAGAVEVDEDRLAREIAYLAEKWDIAEEIVRLRSHVAFFLEQLGDAGTPSERSAASGGVESSRPATVPAPVGKRLGFVVQEMNREANTLGSKANDAGISESAVAVKEELERIREQLENVE